MSQKVLVIVPTYNEKENLPSIIERVLHHSGIELLIVDGNSPDGSGQIADTIAAQNPRVHVLHEPAKKGIGPAYVSGFRWALQRDYEFIFEMDGDISHNPDDIPAFLEAAQNADLVLGSRYKDGIRVINWPLRRLMLSMGAGKYVRLVTGMPFTDPTGGYKCFRRASLQNMNLDAVLSDGYSFQIEMTHKLWREGMRIAEVPIVFRDRIQGSSKMSRKIVFEAFWMVWRLWFQNGLRRRPRRR
jgi:dolichol-phosphate mannosyltransferase